MYVSFKNLQPLHCRSCLSSGSQLHQLIRQNPQVKVNLCKDGCWIDTNLPPANGWKRVLKRFLIDAGNGPIQVGRYFRLAPEEMTREALVAFTSFCSSILICRVLHRKLLSFFACTPVRMLEIILVFILPDSNTGETWISDRVSPRGWHGTFCQCYCHITDSLRAHKFLKGYSLQIMRVIKLTITILHGKSSFLFPLSHSFFSSLHALAFRLRFDFFVGVGKLPIPILPAHQWTKIYWCNLESQSADG